MKKILFSLFLLLAMLAGSCKKDKPLTLEQKILGKWTWVSLEDFHTPADPADYTTNLPAGSYWEFKADKSLTAVVTGTPTENYTWFEVDNNSFMVSIDPIHSFKIIKATANQLVLQVEELDNGIPNINRFTFSKP